MFYDHTEINGPVTFPGYGRYPHVRINLPDGRVFDGRIAAWTTDKVLADWVDPDVNQK